MSASVVRRTPNASTDARAASRIFCVVSSASATYADQVSRNGRLRHAGRARRVGEQRLHERLGALAIARHEAYARAPVEHVAGVQRTLVAEREDELGAEHVGAG